MLTFTLTKDLFDKEFIHYHNPVTNSQEIEAYSGEIQKEQITKCIFTQALSYCLNILNNIKRYGNNFNDNEYKSFSKLFARIEAESAHIATLQYAGEKYYYEVYMRLFPPFNVIMPLVVRKQNLKIINKKFSDLTAFIGEVAFDFSELSQLPDNQEIRKYAELVNS